MIALSASAGDQDSFSWFSRQPGVDTGTGIIIALGCTLLLFVVYHVASRLVRRHWSQRDAARLQDTASTVASGPAGPHDLSGLFDSDTQGRPYGTPGYGGECTICGKSRHIPDTSETLGMPAMDGGDCVCIGGRGAQVATGSESD